MQVSMTIDITNDFYMESIDYLHMIRALNHIIGVIKSLNTSLFN